MDDVGQGGPVVDPPPKGWCRESSVVLKTITEKYMTVLGKEQYHRKSFTFCLTNVSQLWEVIYIKKQKYG
jgi:hypothetical protein